MRLQVFTVLALAGCAAKGPQHPAAEHHMRAASTSAFDHALHSGGKAAAIPALKSAAGSGKLPVCTDCHTLIDATQGTVKRPGTNEHAPCDTCHKAEFFKPPGIFCKVCHEQVDPRKNDAANPATMTPWPPSFEVRQRAARFNHQFHLDNDMMEKRVGFHVSCRDCHLRKEGEEKAAMAGHVTCSKCHTPDSNARTKFGGEGGGAPKIVMTDCIGCHVSEDNAVPQGRRFITKDLRFSHARHEKDAAGKPVPCSACHKAVRLALSVEKIQLPAMVDCATCHEDPKRTPEKARISNCGFCHSEISAGTAPRNHLGGQMPDNHTIAFRTDHGDAARSPQARCRFCHAGMSATPRDNCFECHTIMKPRNHTLRWASTEHGPEAAMQREKCATCHEVDYCSRCHSQRPLSHVPFEAWLSGGHAIEARLNMRNCMACHNFESTCGRCHQGRAFPGGVR